jgi:histidine phosphotransferase ChpT
LMNMLLIAAAAVPRGGVVTVAVEGPAGQESFSISAKAKKVYLPQGSEDLLSGTPEEGVDARSIQPFYTGILARLTEMELKIWLEEEAFFFTAKPKQAEAAADEAGAETETETADAVSEPFTPTDEKSA